MFASIESGNKWIGLYLKPCNYLKINADQKLILTSFF